MGDAIKTRLVRPGNDWILEYADIEVRLASEFVTDSDDLLHYDFSDHQGNISVGDVLANHWFVVGFHDAYPSLMESLAGLGLSLVTPRPDLQSVRDLILREPLVHLRGEYFVVQGTPSDLWVAHDTRANVTRHYTLEELNAEERAVVLAALADTPHRCSCDVCMSLRAQPDTV